MIQSRIAAVTLAICALSAHAQDSPDGGMDMRSPMALFMQGMSRSEPIEIADGVYQAVGFSNTFLITTDEGCVIVDTGLAPVGAAHKRLLGPLVETPVKFIVLTHGHPDHRQGIDLWREEGTEVIAHKNYPELRHYQERLAGAFYRRNFAQYYPMVPKSAPPSSPGNFGAEIEATILIGDEYRFTLGGIEFVCFHAPGETDDQINLWIPEKGIVFVGDNYYDSFPNIYTLRGGKTRYALDYVQAADRVMDLDPDIVLPSHGLPLKGKETIRKSLTKYRDAILYVHDAVVEGMNEGKDVHTLMSEITLPESLDVGQNYGNVPWSVRGIYEGYVGWFDENPANMYASPPSAIYPDLVELAGGVEAIIGQAEARLAADEPIHALRLVDIALAVEADNKTGLTAKLDALQKLEAVSDNSNERGWLVHAIDNVKKQIETE